MIKAVCDFTGKTPAKPVQVIVDGSLAIGMDLCQDEIDALVTEIRNKIQVTDIQPIMKDAKA